MAISSSLKPCTASSRAEVSPSTVATSRAISGSAIDSAIVACPAAQPCQAVAAWPVLTVNSLRSMYGPRASTQVMPGMSGSCPAKGPRSTAHSWKSSTVTSRPEPSAWTGTIRSTAVLANSARSSRSSPW